jgi:predicted DNA repair protein MutK
MPYVGLVTLLGLQRCYILFEQTEKIFKKGKEHKTRKERENASQDEAKAQSKKRRHTSSEKHTKLGQLGVK